MSFEVDGAPIAAGGTADRLLSWERVQDITGISRSTAWRMQRTGDFPKPVRVSPGRVGWWESELTAWKGLRLGSGKGRTPAARPRLPGMARSMPTRTCRPASDATTPEDRPQPAPEAGTAAKSGPRSAQAGLPFGDQATEHRPPRTSSRKRAVSPDQIDFGF